VKAGGWKRLYNEKLRKLYSLPNIVRMNTPVRMRWARHVASMEENMKGRDHLENLGVDVRLILE